MSRSRFSSIAAVVFLLIAAVVPAAADAPLVTIRAESLASAVDLMTAIGSEAEPTARREAVLADLKEMIGIPDLSLVDLGRPAALAMPVEGLAFGSSGFVLVVPVRDTGGVLAALQGHYGPAARQGELHVFEEPPGEDSDGSAVAQKLYVQFQDQFLLMSNVGELVQLLDLGAVLSGDGLPAGPIALTVQLEPIAPVLRSGLLAARTKMRETVAASSAAEAEGTAAAPSRVSPEVAIAMADLYLDVLQAALDSVSTYQLSLAATERDLVVRQRLVPRPGNSLAGFLAAQRDMGMPSVGGMLPAETAFRLVGRVTWTDPARVWVGDLGGRFQDIFLKVARSPGPATQESSPELESSAALLMEPRPEQILRCQHGDQAASMDFGPAGVSMLQVVGLMPDEECRSLLERTETALRERFPDAVSREGIEPGGHPTWVTRVSLSKVLAHDGNLARTFGPEVLQLRASVVGDLLISGTDAWATKAIRSVLDSPGEGVTGIDPFLADLAPLTAGAGFYGFVDLGRILRTAAAEGVDGGMARDEPLLHLEGADGKLRFVLGTDGRAATADIALPFALMKAIAELAPDDAPAGGGSEEADGNEDPRYVEPPPGVQAVTGEVIAPQLVVKVDPEYPEGARRDRVTGRVTLQAIIDDKGKVRDVKVMSSPDDRLASAARKAVRKWKYQPAKLKGKPVAVYFTVVVNFTLD